MFVFLVFFLSSLVSSSLTPYLSTFQGGSCMKPTDTLKSSVAQGTCSECENCKTESNIVFNSMKTGCDSNLVTFYLGARCTGVVVETTKIPSCIATTNEYSILSCGEFMSDSVSVSLGSSPPTGSPVTSKPSKFPSTSRPTAAPVSSKPTTSPVTSKPTASPQSSNPTASPVSSKPTTSPQSSNPTASPVSSKPTTSPQSSNPTAAPVSSKPSASPITAKPTVSPLKPTSSPVTSKPTASPVASMTTLAPVAITLNPTASPGINFVPTASPTSTSPTAGPVLSSNICKPQQGLSKRECTRLMKKCDTLGFPMKWNGQKCPSLTAGSRPQTSGCQCLAYCAYSCRKACVQDASCYWQNGACYNSQTGQRGTAISRCPFIRIEA